MKINRFLHLLGILLVACLLSCEGARDRRKERPVNYSPGGNNTGVILPGIPTTQNDDDDDGSPGTVPSPTPVDNFPVEFNHGRGQFMINNVGGYRFGSTAQNSPMGPYNICKNSNNEVLIQPQVSITNARVCIIPAIKNVINGTEITSSLGNPQCSLFPQAGGYYRFSLNVTRPGVNPNMPINTVVIVRDDVLLFETIANSTYAFFFQGINSLLPASQAFITCMNAVEAYQAIPQGLQAAVALCEEFKSKASYDDPSI